MNFSRLEKNIIDNIKEAQLKIGYDGRKTSLNYMNSSLCHLVGTECNMDVLADFAEYTKNRLGQLKFRTIKDGWCITVSEEGTAYVNNLAGYDFLNDLINAVRRHGTTMEQVLDIFRKYSTNITVEEIHNNEFDLLVCSDIDEYYYCLADECCHVSYHRFIREDYIDLKF